MSSPSLKLSYASVVAGVKPDDQPAQPSSDPLAAEDHSKPQASADSSTRSRGAKGGKGRPKPKPRTRAPRAGAAAISDSVTVGPIEPAQQTHDAAASAPALISPPANVSLVQPTTTTTTEEAALSLKSLSVENIENGDSAADSIPDSGAIYDPEDSNYRGRSANTVVVAPDTESIIKTRAARAAESQKVKSTLLPLNPEHVVELTSPSIVQPPMDKAEVDTGHAKQTSSFVQVVTEARKPTKSSTRARSTRLEGARSVGLNSKSRVVSTKRPRPTNSAPEEAELEHLSDGPTRKRLRTERPKPPVVLVSASDDDESDVFMDNPASSGYEDNGIEYSSDPGSLEDFIVDDDAISDNEVSDREESGTQKKDMSQNIDKPEEHAYQPPAKEGVIRDDLSFESATAAASASSVKTLPTVQHVKQEPLDVKTPDKNQGNVPMPARPARKGQSLTLDTKENAASPSLATAPRTRLFGAVVAAIPSKKSTDTAATSSNGRLLDDLYHFKVEREPDMCEVSSEELQDPLLRDFYVDCPKLRSGSFQSWSEAEGPGMVSFSRWGESCPEMNFDTCISVIQFVQSGRYINPSRISPTKACVKYIPAARPKYHLCNDNRDTAICLSSVMCVASHVVEPPERGLKQKWLSGIFHSQEWERFVGFMCMAFGHDTLHAQLAKDAIQFTTRAHFGNRGGASSHTKRSMFSNIRSPSIVSKYGGSSVKAADDAMTLDFDAPIPVYDCRGLTIDFTQGIGDLGSYPRWSGEIPYGSFIVVAYTVAVFRATSTNAWTISLNLQWAMILGVNSDHE